MTFPQWHFFTEYMARLDIENFETSRYLHLPIDDFKEIMEIPDCTGIEKKVEEAITLLQKITLTLPLNNEGYATFPVFTDCMIYKDNFPIANITDGDEYFVANTTDLALLLLIGYQKYYFFHQTWIGRHLKNANHARMYENIKQYLYDGEVTISLADLRKILGVAPDKYIRWDNFKFRVLDYCQKEIALKTDIDFNYEPVYEKGMGRKVQSLKFTITQKYDYIDQLTGIYYGEMYEGSIPIYNEITYFEYPVSILNEDEIDFIKSKEKPLSNIIYSEDTNNTLTPYKIPSEMNQLHNKATIASQHYTDEELKALDQVSGNKENLDKWIEVEGLEYLRESCKKEFSIEQIKLLSGILCRFFDFDIIDADILLCYDILKSAYSILESDRTERQKIGKEIEKPFEYMKLLLAKNLEKEFK